MVVAVFTGEVLMKSFWRNNSLSIVMFGAFLVFVVGQSIAGLFHFNDEQVQHGQATLGYLQFLGSSYFLESVFENWESEFLQMGAYVFLTSCLYQKGSAESKSLRGHNEVDNPPKKHPRAPGPVKRGGWMLKIYEHSLSLSLIGLFLGSALFHAGAGAKAHNDENAAHGITATVSTLQYLGTSQFWFESLQNWQSEFLSVGALVILSIYLREKGSPESKPVSSPHHENVA
jgi:hypothetical protein